MPHRTLLRYPPAPTPDRPAPRRAARLFVSRCGRTTSLILRNCAREIAHRPFLFWAPAGVYPRRRASVLMTCGAGREEDGGSVCVCVRMCMCVCARARACVLSSAHLAQEVDNICSAVSCHTARAPVIPPAQHAPRRPPSRSLKRPPAPHPASHARLTMPFVSITWVPKACRQSAAVRKEVAKAVSACARWLLVPGSARRAHATSAPMLALSLASGADASTSAHALARTPPACADSPLTLTCGAWRLTNCARTPPAAVSQRHGRRQVCGHNG